MGLGILSAGWDGIDNLGDGMVWDWESLRDGIGIGNLGGGMGWD